MTDVSAWPGDDPGRDAGAVSAREDQLDHVGLAVELVEPQPELLAVSGETRAALSQVSLVSGLGSSWSQPLLANRPSQIVGSGRKTISSVSPAAARRRAERRERLGRRPSSASRPCRRRGRRRSAFRQKASKSPLGLLALPVVWTMFRPDAASCRRQSAATNLQGRLAAVERGDQGLEIVAVPSKARASPHDSRSAPRGRARCSGRGLVVVEPEADGRLDLAAVGLGELQVAGGVVGRVAAEDHQRRRPCRPRCPRPGRASASARSAGSASTGAM